MLFENRAHNEKAWAIASNPLATEKQWLAACTVLDNQPPPRTGLPSSKPLPGAIGLPWSLAISGVSGLGALMLYGFFLTGLYDAATLLTGSCGIFTGALGFGLIGAGFAAFSSVFAYQQHIWQGGRIWPLLHWTIVGFGALLPLGVLFIFACGSFWEMVTAGLWAAGFVAISVASTICTRKSIKALDSSIGSHRILPYTRSLFVAFGLIMLVCMNWPMAAILVGGARWLWLPVIIVGSGFWITAANNARNAQTASTLALSMWNPLSLASLALLPALVINSVGAVFFPVGTVTFLDFAIGLAAITCLSIGPAIGARMAASSLRRQAELELHNIPHVPLPDAMMESATTESASAPFCAEQKFIPPGGTMNPLSEEAV